MIFSTLALYFILAAPAPLDQTNHRVGEGGKVFVGYLFGSPRDLNFKLYTHLCHAFLTADGDGNLNKGRRVPDPELVAKAHQAGVEVLLSLGGWGWDEQFAAITSKPQSEDRYVESVLRIIDDSDYDGIDIDWEYPDTKEEVGGFARLASRLRQGLDSIAARKGRKLYLTMAASANPGTLSWLDRELILETMDWINVMTYDYTGDWTDYAGHHSPLFASSKQPGPPRSIERTLTYLVDDLKYPYDRLVIGLPLYGRAFAVGTPYADKRNAPRDARLPRGEYSSIDRLLHDDRWLSMRDDETKTPWLIAKDGSAVLGYDDAESIRYKTEWAMGRGFRGVFFWQVNGDRLPDGSNPLQEAARNAFRMNRE
jgi:chitinase